MTPAAGPRQCKAQPNFINIRYPDPSLGCYDTLRSRVRLDL